MKNSNDIIGNRTRDLPTCSAVPQPTAPSRTPHSTLYHHKSTHLPLRLLFLPVSGRLMAVRQQQISATAVGQSKCSYELSEMHFYDLEKTGDIRCSEPNFAGLLHTAQPVRTRSLPLNATTDLHITICEAAFFSETSVTMYSDTSANEDNSFTGLLHRARETPTQPGRTRSLPLSATTTLTYSDM